MSTHVFITEECLAEVQGSFKNELESFRKKVEQATNAKTLFAPFPAPFLVKKKLGGRQGRLIATEQTVPVNAEEYKVIIFLAFLTRSDRRYDTFQQNPRVDGNSYLRRINLNEIKKSIETRLKTDPPKSILPLDDVQQNYLFGGGIKHITDEIMICESKEWVEEIRKPEYEHWLGKIWYELFSNLKNNRDTPVYKLDISGTTISILVSYFPQQRKHFLIGIDSNNDTSFANLRKEYSDFLSVDTTAINDSPQTLTRRIRRMYPEEVLLQNDGKLWIDIQKDPLGNFALSDEEVEILNPQERDKLFPLFINGRAGSGKSTVLQYLYTDYLCRYIVDSSIGSPPAYFTCNESLLDNAKKLVGSLLRCNPSVDSLIKNADMSAENIEKIFDEAFHEFHSYLLSLLPAEFQPKFSARLTEIEKGKFSNKSINGRTEAQIIHCVDKKRFVGFSQFKKLWELFHGQDKNAHKNFGPDISWHVIRSYIKGMSVDEYMEPDDYSLLDKGDQNEENESTHFNKTVTDATFKDVFDKVWEAWYKPLTDSETAIFWDDQDLVRFLLNNERLKPSFAGIFCDESQDFTRIELEAILRLSLFSDRKIQPNEIPMIPFAFAGDEFQTLNPTGFRWDSVKAWFTEKFIFALDPKNVMRHRVNFRELHNNYRSQACIVQFSNRVQMLRSARFGIATLKPQEPWNPKEGSPVIYFTPNANDFWNQKPNGTVLIVPCEDQASVPQYIKDKLAGRITLDESDTPNEMTVLSATEAKGNEFDCVAVYGFAESCPPDFITPFVNERATLTYNPTADIPLEYFINKVYVAVTRAKHRLIIVDSFTDMKQDYFWKPFLGDDILDDKIRKRTSSSVWSDSVLTDMIAGDGRSFQGTDIINITELAEDLAKKGRMKDNPNPGLLRQAAKRYSEIGDVKKSKLCRAEANQLDRNFKAAADGFREIVEDERAVDCYWALAKLDGWKEISNYKDCVSRLEVRFAEALLKKIPPSFESMRTVLLEVNTELLDPAKKTRILDNINPWEVAVKTLLEKFRVKDSEQGKKALRDVNDLCKEINKHGLPCSGYFLWKAGSEINDDDFVVLLHDTYSDSSDADFQNTYQRIVEKRTAYPDSLTFFANRKDYKAIVTAFAEHEDTEIDKSKAALITEAIIQQQEYSRLNSLLPYIRSAEKYKDIRQSAQIPPELSAKCRFLEMIASIENQTNYTEWELFLKKSENQQDLLFVSRALARSNFQDVLREPAIRLRSLYIDNMDRNIPQKYWLEIGAAIERVGKRIDALDYYERVIIKADAEFVGELKKRLIVCKERHADALKDKDIAHRDRLYKESRVYRRELGVETDEKLPDYPIFSWKVLYEDIVKSDLEKPLTSIVPPPVEPQAEVIPVNMISVSKTIFAGFTVERFENKRVNFTDSNGNTLSLVNGKLKSHDFDIPNGTNVVINNTTMVFDLSANPIQIKDSNTGFVLLIPFEKF